jgi:hypothetical protein
LVEHLIDVGVPPGFDPTIHHRPEGSDGHGSGQLWPQVFLRVQTESVGHGSGEGFDPLLLMLDYQILQQRRGFDQTGPSQLEVLRLGILIVIPAVYSLFDGLGSRFTRREDGVDPVEPGWPAEAVPAATL